MMKLWMGAVALMAAIGAGCAHAPPADEFVGMDIRVQFVPENRWPNGPSVLGLAYLKDNKCILMFPAENGFPGYGVLEHEFRHCLEPHFHD